MVKNNPTCELRWIKIGPERVLQQRIEQEQIDHSGVLVARTYYWRVVPVFELPKPDLPTGDEF